MKARRLVIKPELNKRREFKFEGVAVRVISGAWPLWRISFDAPPSDDPNTLDRASGLCNGAVFFPESGADRFTSFWITTSTLQGNPAIGEDLVLEVLDCATPVYVLNNAQGAGWRYHPVDGETIAFEVSPGTPLQLYVDAAWGATSTIDDTAGVEYIPRGFIGGGVTCDAPFEVQAFQFLNKNGTKLTELARWVCDTQDLDGNYGVSFETGGIPAPLNSAIATPTQPGRLIPWPLYGLKLMLCATDEATPTPIENYTWVLYSRDK